MFGCVVNSCAAAAASCLYEYNKWILKQRTNAEISKREKREEEREKRARERERESLTETEKNNKEVFRSIFRNIIFWTEHSVVSKHALLNYKNINQETQRCKMKKKKLHKWRSTLFADNNYSVLFQFSVMSVYSAYCVLLLLFFFFSNIFLSFSLSLCFCFRLLWLKRMNFRLNSKVIDFHFSAHRSCTHARQPTWKTIPRCVTHSFHEISIETVKYRMKKENIYKNNTTLTDCTRLYG